MYSNIKYLRIGGDKNQEKVCYCYHTFMMIRKLSNNNVQTPPLKKQQHQQHLDVVKISFCIFVNHTNIHICQPCHKRNHVYRICMLNT